MVEYIISLKFPIIIRHTEKFDMHRKAAEFPIFYVKEIGGAVTCSARRLC